MVAPGSAAGSADGTGPGMRGAEAGRGWRSDRMPPWIPRAILLAVLAVAGLIAAGWLLGRLRGLLILLLVSLFLAFAIEPAVNWLAAHRWRRGLATGFVFLVIFGLIAIFVYALGSLLADQIGQLVDAFPNYVENVLEWVNRTFDTDLSAAALREQLAGSESLQSYLSGLAGNAVGVSATALGAVFQTFTVLLFTFYLAADGPAIRRRLLSLLPPARQREVMRALDIAITKTGGYIYSRAILAVISGLAHYMALRIIGVPYALALAVWVGIVSQFIPTVGTYLAGLLPVIVALTDQPLDAVWVLMFIITYQQFENYVLQPRITARTMNMHPAVAFGTVIAGAAILGPVGALIALPAGATLQAFIGTYLRRYEVEDHPLLDDDARTDLGLGTRAADAEPPDPRDHASRASRP